MGVGEVGPEPPRGSEARVLCAPHSQRKGPHQGFLEGNLFLSASFVNIILLSGLQFLATITICCAVETQKGRRGLGGPREHYPLSLQTVCPMSLQTRKCGVIPNSEVTDGRGGSQGSFGENETVSDLKSIRIQITLRFRNEESWILCFPRAALPRPVESLDHLEKILQDTELSLGLDLLGGEISPWPAAC